MPSGSRKIALTFGAAGLAALLLAVVPWVVDVDRFRPEAEERLSAVVGRPVGLGPLRLSLWTGPVVVGQSLRIDGEPTFDAKNARIRLSLLPLLTGTVRPRVVRLEDGVLRGRGMTLLEGVAIRCALRDDTGAARVVGRASGAAPALAGRPRTDATFDATFRPAEVEVTRIAWTLGRSTLEAAGRLDGIGTGRTRITMRGSAVLGGAAITDIEGRGILTDGTIRLDASRFAFHGGAGTASASVATSEPTLPFRVETTVAGIRIDDLLAATAPRLANVLYGTAGLGVDVTGRAGAPDIAESLSGTATVEIVDGSLKSVGIVKQAAEILELAGGAGIGKDETPFERVSATFAIERRGARTDDLAFRSAELDLEGGGVIGLDGSLSLDVVAAFSPPVSAGIVGKTPQLRFRVNRDGRLTLPMKIRGTLAAPIVQIDVDRVLREGLRDELRRKGDRWLRGLAGRD